MDNYLIKDETRYFCANKQCMLYPRKTFQNTFSNFDIPEKENNVFQEQIYPDDRAIAFTALYQTRVRPQSLDTTLFTINVSYRAVALFCLILNFL